MNEPEAPWERCRNTFFPRRTVDGGWTQGTGQTWRRRNSTGKWEYRQDDETEEEWLNRQY